MREALILSDGGPALRSYAAVAIAGAMTLLIPCYSRLLRRFGGRAISRVVTAVLVAGLGVLYVASERGLPVGLAFFVWLGAFAAPSFRHSR